MRTTDLPIPIIIEVLRSGAAGEATPVPRAVRREALGGARGEGGFLAFDAAPAANKRQAGGFLASAQLIQVSDCNLAQAFLLSNGTLSAGGQLVSTEPGVQVQDLNVSPVTRSITTTWYILDGFLYWDNAAFYNGSAAFYSTPQGVPIIGFANGAGVPSGSIRINLLSFTGTSPPYPPDLPFIPYPFRLASDPCVYVGRWLTCRQRRGPLRHRRQHHRHAAQQRQRHAHPRPGHLLHDGSALPSAGLQRRTAVFRPERHDAAPGVVDRLVRLPGPKSEADYAFVLSVSARACEVDIYLEKADELRLWFVAGCLRS